MTMRAVKWFRGRARGRDEVGAALELALIFLMSTSVIVGTLLTFASSSSQATVVTRATRGFDYDADAAMQAAIATIRVSTTQGYVGVGKCVSFTPGFTLNNSSRPLRVDCSPFSASAGQRHIILSVCPSSAGAPCADSQALLRADVTFYDDHGFGRAVSIQSWSNQ